MITREEAHKQLEEVIHAIYDSIGSCGECGYREEHKDSSVWCGVHQSPIEDDNAFCSYFTRKKK